MQIGNSVKDSLSNVVLYSVRDGLRITVWGSVENLVFNSVWGSVSESEHILTYDMLWAPITNITHHSSWLLMTNKANGNR